MNLQIDLSELAENLQELIRSEVDRQIRNRMGGVNAQGFEYLSHKQAAALLDCSPSALYHAEIPVFKFAKGGRNYYHIDDLRALMERQSTAQHVKDRAEAQLARVVRK